MLAMNERLQTGSRFTFKSALPRLSREPDLGRDRRGPALQRFQTDVLNAQLPIRSLTTPLPNLFKHQTAVLANIHASLYGSKRLTAAYAKTLALFRAQVIPVAKP